MAPRIPFHWVKMRGCDTVRTVTLAYPFDTVLKPFHQTRLGRLPPELRELIFLELLATPPPYAGHDFAISSSRSTVSRRTSQKFVDIKAAWYHVTRTCRQIYLEAHPLFFASKNYYLANAQDVRLFLKGYPFLQFFRLDTITALCLKDLVECSARWSKKSVDRLLADPTSYYARHYTRQELEAQSDTQIEASVYKPLQRLKNLKTVGLCFAVGEETKYIHFLFGLSGLRRGLVEFLYAQTWIIRPQDAEDVWRIQYAGFHSADWGKNKNGEIIPIDLCLNQRDIADIDSRAPGLQEGDERYVEVQIQWLAGETSTPGYLSRMRSMKYWQSAPNHRDVEQRGPREAQPIVLQDLTESSEAIEATPLAETSEENTSMAGLESQSKQSDQSSLRELQRVMSPELTPDSNTDEVEEHAAMTPASKEVSSTQPQPQSKHQGENHLFLKPLESVTYHTPADTEKDPATLLDRDEEDDRVQKDTETKFQAPEWMCSQHNDEFYGDSATEEDQPQNTVKESRKGGVRRAKLRQAFSQKKQPLLDIVVTPSPYTEEEMQSHEKWQKQTISEDQKQTDKIHHQKQQPSSSFGKGKEQKVETSGGTSQTTTPTENSPASPMRPGWPSKSVQIWGAVVLFLLLVILTLPPERLSNARQERNDSYER